MSHKHSLDKKSYFCFEQKDITVHLTIDIGNTMSKYAIFDKSQIITNGIIVEDQKKWLEQILHSHCIEKCIVSSVSSALNDDFSNVLQRNNIQLVEFNHQTKLPFQNNYKTPETIGLDRLAAVAGALTLYPETNALIIDAGTAITYDFLDKSNRYLGGNIAPGLEMRFKSLNYFTKRLPLIHKSTPTSLIGTTTAEAIRNGVILGLISEIDGIIDQFKQVYPELSIVFTGGDAIFFEPLIKNRIFVHPNLVLEGLNRILSIQNAIS